MIAAIHGGMKPVAMQAARLRSVAYGCAVALLCALTFVVAHAEPLLLEVASAVAGFEPRTNEPIVTITLTETSRRAFAQFTTSNVGKAAELRVDGRALMKPVIREPILGGVLQITGRFTVAEARDYAARLSAGSAKVEVEIVPD